MFDPKQASERIRRVTYTDDSNDYGLFQYNYDLDLVQIQIEKRMTSWFDGHQNLDTIEYRPSVTDNLVAGYEIDIVTGKIVT